jgi:glutamyl-tRNA reductase
VRLLLVGMNHRTAPLAVRERFAVAHPAAWLPKLVDGEEVVEGVLVSTCNRVEALVRARNLDAARHRLRAFFARELGRGEPLPHDLSWDAVLYEYVDSAAIRHVFRVASSIDSMVVGEPQILGQLKDAYRDAVECGACGAILNRLFHRAFATAKRVRSITGIAARPISVARVAVELSRQIFETLDGKTALLVGAGEMVELTLEALHGDGLAAIRVANRTRAHAEELAARFHATAHGLDELPGLLARSDVVLTSLAAATPMLDAEPFRVALHERRRRPIFVIDLGVPRNVDPEVDQLDGVYLYDLDDLAGVSRAHAEVRRRETVRAEAIVQGEVERFDGWLSALHAVPTIRHLRGRAEAIRSRELERAANRLGLSEEQRRGVDALTRAVVNKLLHAPLSRLRRTAEREEGIAYLEAARVLFALDDPGAPGAEADPAGDSSPDDA